MLQEIYIDIPYRDPIDGPDGVPYRLVAECCNAGFDTEDIKSIFEEHHICRTVGSWYCANFKDGCGLYIQDEKKFLFSNVLVGSRVKARFKLKNINKVNSSNIILFIKHGLQALLLLILQVQKCIAMVCKRIKRILFLFLMHNFVSATFGQSH